MPQLVDVRGSDVLLFRGDSWISRAIRWFDHSEVNHAAIALDAATLAEATGSGLKTGAIANAVNGNLRTLQRRHVDNPAIAGPVAVAHQYEAQHVPYAYHQIVLLAILATTRKIPLPWVAKRLVRSALDHAADAIGAILDGDVGTRFMICSEYVYRCYDEASNEVPDPYDLALDLGGASPLLAGAAAEQTTTFLQWALEQSETTASEAGAVVEAATRTPLGAVFDEATAEADLERLIQEYAVTAAPSDPVIAADLADAPRALADAPSALADAEPTPEELLAAHIRLARALEASRDDPDPVEPLGIGSDVLRGLVSGLLKVQGSPNFVTPGDLLARAAKLRTVGDVRR